MVRNSSRKTARLHDPELIKAAVKEVLEHKQPIRTVANKHSIDRMTLTRYVNKAKNGDTSAKLNYNIRQVFSDEEENILEDYLKRASLLHFGLSYKSARELAFQFADKNDIPMPPSWRSNKIAGIDWLQGFLKRHSMLSLRTPEATSLSRATSFNRTNVSHFFNKLQDLLKRGNFGPGDIYNTDETGLTTVQKPAKVIAQKGAKQIGRMTSAERGALVTLCAAVNALGSSIPPLFIFPRVNFKDCMIKGGPVGCIGLSHISGWMTAENL
ncbi:hypothetical protein BsWGS_11908 [Bradybaena similaris]